MIGEFKGHSPIGIENEQPTGFVSEDAARQFAQEWVADDPDLLFRLEWNPARTRCFVEFFLMSPHWTVGWA